MKNRNTLSYIPETGNMNTAGHISRNTLSLLSSRIFEYFCFFLFSVYYIPRLGPHQYGVFKYATSLTGLFFILADFGLGMMIIREIARLPLDKRPPLISLVLFLKILLAFLTFGLIMALTFLIHKDPQVRFIITLFGITTILNSMIHFYCGVFQGYEKMHLIVIVRILTTIAICVPGFAALERGFGITGLAVANIVGNVCGLLIALIIAGKLCGRLSLRMDWGKASSLLKIAFPFGVFTLFSTIYVQIDNVMIFHIKGDEALGIYAAATRIIIAVCFFTEAFMGTLYPILSRYFIEDRERLEKTYLRALWFLYITGLPATIGLWCLAKPLVVFLFGATYEKSGPVLSLLSVMIFLRFVGNVPATLLTAINKQIIRMWIVISASVLNIILNLFLIRHYSYYGAAYATLIVNFLLLLVFYYMGHRLNFRIDKILPRLVKPTIATGIMFFFLIISARMHVIVQFFIGVLVYGSALLLLGSFNRDERELFRKAVSGIVRQLGTPAKDKHN
jgi:O-antigen/teichoic acid export membrane protein